MTEDTKVDMPSEAADLSEEKKSQTLPIPMEDLM